MIIEDAALLLQMKLTHRCEWCGRKGPVDVHHLWAKGMGGGGRLDIPINLACLCRVCHQDTHQGLISREDLLAVVAAREDTTQDKIIDQINLLRRTPK